FLLSESVTRMNDCPRRYTQKKAAYRSVSPLYAKPRFGGVLLSESVTQMNDCPRRYTQKKAAYRSVATISIKPLDEGVYF
ncbi:hypothetical protein, partial [Klebsiella quasipneumoniae]|uniref:hypothetical protein n=1 Tax=Klebsiella quasipneumoniae TaxID=1463165 RepID=UPI001CFBEC74